MRRRKHREESDQTATEDVGAEAQKISEEIGEDVGSENNFEDETTKEGSKSDDDVLLRDMLKEDMLPFTRLLHLVVIKSVVSRAGKRSEARFLDLILMEYLIKGRQINLPKLMLEHISHAVSRANHALPYGMCLTKVLKHFQVPLCANEKNDRIDYFGESFLRKVELNLIDGV
ncbi:hypothetical protein Dimus_018957 [Dionaea muscipula]